MMKTIALLSILASALLLSSSIEFKPPKKSKKRSIRRPYIRALYAASSPYRYHQNNII